MEVEGREVRDAGHGFEVERAVEVPIDMLDHSVHPAFVLGTAVSRAHAPSRG